MDDGSKLSASLEDYLETIFQLVQEKTVARAKDIARKLEVNNSSVTGALRALAKRDLVNYAPYEIITLTTKGEEAARAIVRRHNNLKEFLVSVLAIREEDAEQAACRLEHAVSRIVFERLTLFAEFAKARADAGAEWLQDFAEICARQDAQGNAH